MPERFSKVRNRTRRVTASQRVMEVEDNRPYCNCARAWSGERLRSDGERPSTLRRGHPCSHLVRSRSGLNSLVPEKTISPSLTRPPGVLVVGLLMIVIGACLLASSYQQIGECNVNKALNNGYTEEVCDFAGAGVGWVFLALGIGFSLIGAYYLGLSTENHPIAGQPSKSLTGERTQSRLRAE